MKVSRTAYLKSLSLCLTLLAFVNSPGVSRAQEGRPKPRPRYIPAPLAPKAPENFGTAPSFRAGSSLRVSVSMRFADTSSFEQAYGFIGSDNYFQVMQKAAEQGARAEKIRPINTPEKLEREFLKTYDAGVYRRLSLQQRANLLKKFVRDSAGVDVSYPLVLSELAIARVKANPGAWRSTLQSVKGDLSFSDKISIASHFGGEFSDDYNDGRAGAGRNSGGVVDIETLLTNLNNDELGGVCRDIVLAQSQMLAALDVPTNNIYSSSFATVGGHHAVLVVQDPNERKKIVKVNYDFVQVTEGLGGPGALEVEGTLANVGIANKIYDYEGRPAGIVPTEIGEIFREVTGGDNKFLLQTPSYSLQKVVAEYRWGRATVFGGQTGATGDQFLGVAFDKAIDRGNGEHYRIGVAFMDRSGDGRERVYLDQQVVYARMKYWIERNLFRAENLTVKGLIGGEAEVAGMYTSLARKSDDFEKEDFNIDTNVRAFTGVEGVLRVNDRTQATLGVLATGYLDFANVAVADRYTVGMDSIDAKFGIEHEINAAFTVEGKAILTFQPAGRTLTLAAGAEHTRFGVGGEVICQKPLDEMPIFFEGSTDVCGVGLEKQIGPRHEDGHASRLVVDFDKDFTLGSTSGGIKLEIPLRGMMSLRGKPKWVR